MRGTVKALDTLDTDTPRTLAFNARTHLDEHFSQVADLGLLCRVFQHGFAVGQGGCHHKIFGTCHSHHVCGEVASLQAFQAWCQSGHHVAMLDDNLGAHGLQTLDVLVHRPRANRATAGQRDRGSAKTCQQRAQCQHRSTHCFHQVIGRLWLVQPARIDAHGTGVVLAGRALLGVHAHVANQLEHGRHILQPRHIGQGDRLAAEQRCAQLGQGGVFGPRNINGAGERLTALDA